MNYQDRYDPQLLSPISRQPQREEIGIVEPLPFWGLDIWTAYELSWLNSPRETANCHSGPLFSGGFPSTHRIEVSQTVFEFL